MLFLFPNVVRDSVHFLLQFRDVKSTCSQFIAAAPFMSPSATHAVELPRTLTLVVAVVGCDGTGKSRLTADLLKVLRARGPAVRRYMGLVSGEAGKKIKGLPVIGVRLERYLAAKASRAQDTHKKLPGTFTAVVMHLFSLWRARQLRRVIRLSRKGVMVVADRYPQAEIPGFHFDGPGFKADPGSNRLIRWLSVREQRLYDRMALQRPVMIIRLNIDIETAYARKSDHRLSELRNKISVMPRLTFNGARVCDIDASVSYPEMLDAALKALAPVVEHTGDRRVA